MMATAHRLAWTLPAAVQPCTTAAHKGTLSSAAPAHPPLRPASAATELAALVALATALGDAPHTVCQLLADQVLALLKAGSAGVSVMSTQADGAAWVHWPAIAGRWQAHSGHGRLLLEPGDSARNSITPAAAAEHALVVPFGAAGETAGTVWAVTHAAASDFSAEDLRQLQNLALFAAPALQAVTAREAAQASRPAAPALDLRGSAESRHATFTHLIDNAPFGVYVVDAQFRLCQASAAARKVLANVQPLIGRDFGEVVRAVWPEPFASGVLTHFRRTLDSGVAHAEPTLGELRKDTPGTESYDWTIDRIVLPDGGFGVVCYFYDLTERQQAAEALRLRTAQFETLFNGAPLGIFLVDSALRICQVNPQALPEFGDIQGLIGQELSAVMQTVWGPARAAAIVQKFRHTLDSGEPFEAEEVIAERVDRGTTACYEWQIHRMPLPDGSHGVVCHFREMSVRVRAQAQIRDSELRFRAFVTASAHVIYRVSPDWREMRQLHGGHAVADTSQPSVDWLQRDVHPEDRARVLAAVDVAIADKSLFDLEYRMVRADGELGWTRSRAVPLLDDSGAIVEWFGTASDITERRRAEEALRASEEQFRATFETAAIGIVHVGLDHRWLRVNPAMCSLTGYSADELTAMAFTALTHPDDLADDLRQLHRLRAGEMASYKIEKRFIHRSGRNVWVAATASLLRDAHGQPLYYIGALEDITEQKATLAQLELQRRFVERLTHSMPSTLHVYGRSERRNLWVNRHLGTTLGYSGDDIAQIGADFMRQVLHPEDVAALDLHLDRVFASADDAAQDIELRVRDQAGRWRWLHQTDTVFRRAPDGLAVELVGTATDVTARKAIEAALLAALAAAEDANLAKSDFLSRMSHELRSPLNAVLGFAQLLQSGMPPPTPRQDECATEILQAGWYLLGLIDEILDLSLIESGRLDCVLEPVPLAEVLSECIALVEGQAAACGIRLGPPQLDGACTAFANRIRLKQVVINILGNAIKYNREGGTVQVRCEAVGPLRLCIRIEDSGNGLNPGQLGRIFKPFERLGQETGPIEGTGIGLALSKRLVEWMGGRIGVHSVVGQGSVFWVELAAPATAPANGPTTIAAGLRRVAAPRPGAAGRRPCTVLCVEDNRANQLLVQRLLARRTDVRLLLAGDGQHGVQLARAMQPDVVLMDINLPDISGLEAMRHLAADTATARIPVIAISALAMRHDIEKGLKAGFFRYLSKPIRIDALTEALDAALDLAHRP